MSDPRRFQLDYPPRFKPGDVVIVDYGPYLDRGEVLDRHGGQTTRDAHGLYMVRLYGQGAEPLIVFGHESELTQGD